MKVKIKTLTPLLIGGDAADIWSPYSDYVWQAGELMIIDNQKLEARLTREQVQEYVEKINRSIHNTLSEYSLKEFLQENKIPWSEITRYRFPLDTNPGRKTIKKFIRTAGRTFIPGSSLKGGMRTAFLWSWLGASPSGQQHLQRLKQSLEKMNRRLSFHEKNALKKELGGAGIETSAFGSPQKDFFKNIQISDSPPLADSPLKIATINRFNLKTGQAESPLWAEVLPSDVETECRLNLSRPDSGDPFILRLASWEELCRMLNKFSRTSLERELEKLPRTDFAPVIQRYQSLLEILTQLPPEQAIVRLGQGKTIFDNSLLTLIENEPAFYSFRELFELGKNPRTKKISPGEFPLTRSFIVQNQRPAEATGWILLQGERA